jgi:ferredoxin
MYSWLALSWHCTQHFGWDLPAGFASYGKNANILAHKGFLSNLARPDFGKDLDGTKMADAANKYPENVEGKFYVDDQCIDCDLCRETAPANFKRNDDGGHSFVYKQAETPEEEALCKEAMEGCPVEAIGSDGA